MAGWYKIENKLERQTKKLIIEEDHRTKEPVAEQLA